jgi:hypothetical protein
VAGQIDRDKLRTSLRELGRAYIFYMLYDAIELMPSAKLQKLVEPYFDLETLRSDGNPQRACWPRWSPSRARLAAAIMKTSASTPQTT